MPNLIDYLSGKTYRGEPIFAGSDAVNLDEKHTAHVVKQEIDRVLWEVWDPIGINELPDAPPDEYSSYVNGVFELLVNGASDDAIARHLFAIVADRMELSVATCDDMRPTVRALRKIALPSQLRTNRLRL